jgi:hypothetical protein
MPAPVEMTPEFWKHVLAVFAKHEATSKPLPTSWAGA